MNYVFTWIKASRLPAQLFIFPALLLGQTMYFYKNQTLDISLFFLVHIYGLCMHLYIVYANDYADFETDALNHTYTPFTGGSRVIVDGLIKKDSIGRAAIFMAVAVMIVALVISWLQNSLLIGGTALAGIILLQMYSFPPVCLSYRGFGEILQVFGVGIILPLFGYLSQGGQLFKFSWIFILCLLPSQLAMAMSTSLPDEPSDRQSNKNTSIVLLGANLSRVIIPGLYILAAVLLLYVPGFLLEDSILKGFILIVLAGICSERLASARGLFFPGSLSLTIFVFLSILINTSLWFWISCQMYYMQ